YLVLFSDQIVSSRQPIDLLQAKQVLGEVKFGGGTAIYDAIDQTCKHQLSWASNPDKVRRGMFLISDGEDNSSRIDRLKAEHAAQEEGVAIFTLMTHPSFAGPRPRGERSLKELSKETGGFVTDRNLKDAVPLAESLLRSQWIFSFDPAKSDQKLHPL